MNNNTNNADESILSFGSSVVNSDALRHSIREEVSEIESQTSKSEQESSKEKRIAQELFKALVNTRKEMHNLRRGTSDIVDASKMNDTLRSRMMRDLQSELMLNNNSNNKNNNNKRNNNHAPALISDNEDEFDNNAPPLPSPTSIMMERKDSIKLSTANVKKLEETHKALKSKMADVHENCAYLQNQIHSEELENKVKNAERELQEGKKELEQEQRRGGLTREAIHESRTKSGMHAQEIADFTKQMTTTKSSNEEERKEITALMAKEAQELVALQKNDVVERELKELDQVVELLSQQINQAAAARECRQVIMEQVATVKQETQKLVAIVAKTNDELVEDRQALVAATKQKDEAITFREQVDSQKNHNNHVETKAKEAEKTLQEAQAEKTQLVERVEGLVELGEEAQKQLQEKIDSMEPSLEKVNAEHQRLSDKILESETTLVDKKRALEEVEKDTEKELQQHSDLETKFRNAQKAEKVNKDEITKQKRSNRDAAIEAARTKSGQEREEREAVLELSLKATDMEEEAKKYEKEVARLLAERAKSG